MSSGLPRMRLQLLTIVAILLCTCGVGLGSQPPPSPTFAEVENSAESPFSLDRICSSLWKRDGRSPASAFAFRMMTYNVWNFDSGSNWDQRKRVVAELIKASDVDVVALQELRWHPEKGDMVKDLVEEIGEDHPLTTTVIQRGAMAYDDRTVEGLAIFSRFPLVGRTSSTFRINAYEPLGDMYDNNQRIGLLARLNITEAVRSRYRCPPFDADTTASASSSTSSSPSSSSLSSYSSTHNSNTPLLQGDSTLKGDSGDGYVIDVVSTHFSYSRSHQHGNAIDLAYFLEEARRGEAFLNSGMRSQFQKERRGRGRNVKKIPKPVEKTELRGTLMGQFVGGDFNTYTNFQSPLLLLTEYALTKNIHLFEKDERCLSDSFIDANHLSLLDPPKQEDMTFPALADAEPKARCDGVLYRQVGAYSTILEEPPIRHVLDIREGEEEVTKARKRRARMLRNGDSSGGGEQVGVEEEEEEEEGEWDAFHREIHTTKGGDEKERGGKEKHHHHSKPNALVLPISSTLFGSADDNRAVAEELGMDEDVVGSDHKAVITTFAVVLPPFPSSLDEFRQVARRGDEYGYGVGEDPLMHGQGDIYMHLPRHDDL